MMRTRSLTPLVCAAIAVSALTAGTAARASSGSCRALPVSALPLATLEASYRTLTDLPPGTPLTASLPHRYGICATTHYAFQPMTVARGVHLSYQEQVDQQDHSATWRENADGTWINEGITSLCAQAPHALINDWRLPGVRCRVAAAATPVACGSVNDSHGNGHLALNDLMASGVSCAVARSLASAYLEGHALPSGWHVKPNSIVTFTRGSERVTGEEVG